MASDEPTETPAPGEDGNEDSPQGVFGNLPQTRPGARSPRRDSSARPRAEPGAAPAAPASGGRSSAPAHDAGGAEKPPQAARASPDGGGQAPGVEGGGIEDVAWAGVAAAAEAATIGVRLATRALEAMRDAVDRR